MYEVYRSDKLDTTYMGDYYNYDDATNPEKSYSLSLLVSRNPVHKEETMAQALTQYGEKQYKKEIWEALNK